MIIKGYSCENCIHEAICHYKKDMTKLWDKIQSINNSNNFYPLEFKHDFLPPPSVGYYSLKCNYFKEQEGSYKYEIYSD